MVSRPENGVRSHALTEWMEIDSIDDVQLSDAEEVTALDRL
jgi:hypothetical protein